MNSFGSHHGKIDPVFLSLPKELLQQRMWLSSLKENQLGSGMAAPRLLEFYWKFLAVVWFF